TSMSPRRATMPAWSRPPAAAPIASLQVLHLLAKLLDHALELEPDIGELDVVRFRAQGIGLAIELLGEKIEAPADRGTLCQQVTGLSDMSCEAVKLLAHVDLGGDQDRLLIQPVTIKPVRGVKQLGNL